MSTLKANVKRHCIRIHALYENTPCENVATNVDNVAQNVGNVAQNAGNVAQNIGNVAIDEKITSDSKCSHCNKVYKQSRYLKAHEKQCNGITSLQCSLCHILCPSRSAKSRHLKKCTGAITDLVATQLPQTIIDHSQTAETINNNTTNNININNNNTVNNITNNTINNIIVYNDENIEFKDDHITRKDLKRIFHDHIKTIQAISEYAQKLFENTENLCIRKKHITNSYCEVHNGDGIWKTRPEKSVFDRFSQDVAISANDKLYDHPNIGTKKVRDEITELVSEPGDVHSQAIQLRREMRSLIIDKTKELFGEFANLNIIED